MGWFNKKKSEKKESPALPELPKLPELPQIKGKTDTSLVHQLPSFPTNSLGEKFSQNTIKEAVTGKKEGEEVFETDDFVQKEDEMRMMQKPLKEPSMISYSGEGGIQKTREIPEGFREAARMAKKAEPIFIRIDKFEESLQIFEKTKKQILEIEKMLRDIKKIKEEEEKELEFWESRIKATKEQIEKIDRDIFSKIE